MDPFERSEKQFLLRVSHLARYIIILSDMQKKKNKKNKQLFTLQRIRKKKLSQGNVERALNLLIIDYHAKLEVL